MKNPMIFIVLFFGFTLQSKAQEPEQQISFAKEFKSVEYYTEQAELWWNEVEKDSSSENNWYNYFRACRNTEGRNDWKSDFIDLSPSLMKGADIVQRIKNNLPNSFTYYYVSYLTNGIGTDNYKNLLKAYEMNPSFPGIHSSMISYAESSNNMPLREEVNKQWAKTNYISYQLFNYNYNVLMSLDSNAILFTQSDNDTYPTWLLQDARGIRKDVKVINIDFLLLEDFRNTLFAKFEIPPLQMDTIDIDEYHLNWQKVVSYVIKNYKGERPIYLGMTLFNHLYKEFENELYITGLAFKHSKKNLDTSLLNRKLVEDTFRLDYLYDPFMIDQNQMNINYQNANYIQCFLNVYQQYRKEEMNEESEKLKTLSLVLADRVQNPAFYKRVETLLH